jgi:hypothetical protein
MDKKETKVRVKAGACGFVSVITTSSPEKRKVTIQVDSDCQYISDLGFILQELGSINFKEIITTNPSINAVFKAAGQVVPHSACPVAVAVLKAAEVPLGLNIPKDAEIVFIQETTE